MVRLQANGGPQGHRTAFTPDPVAGADDGLDHRRVAELAAQVHHRHPDGVGERVGVLVPHPFQQLLGADHGAAGARMSTSSTASSLWVTGSGRPARVTKWRAGSRTMSPTSRTGFTARRPRRASARMRATSSAKAKGLPEVVVGAEHQPGHPVVEVAGGGQHQDPGTSAAPAPATRRSASGTRRRRGRPGGPGRGPRRRSGWWPPSPRATPRRRPRRPPSPPAASPRAMASARASSSSTTSTRTATIVPAARVKPP